MAVTQPSCHRLLQAHHRTKGKLPSGGDSIKYIFILAMAIVVIIHYSVAENNETVHAQGPIQPVDLLESLRSKPNDIKIVVEPKPTPTPEPVPTVRPVVPTSRSRQTNTTVRVSAVPVDRQNNRDRVANAVRARWGESEVPAALEIINRESGFNHLAVNPSSGACGLAQALPCGKQQRYGADYRTNPDTQIAFFLEYTFWVYGTPSKALQFHLSRGWY